MAEGRLNVRRSEIQNQKSEIELTPWLIRYAYSQGAFPMADEEGEIEWFQPVERALFPIEGIHVSRSLSKVLMRQVIDPFSEPPHEPRTTTHETPFTISFDATFEQVMRSCLRPRDNWISEELIRAYTQIHHEGWGHSVEVWAPGSNEFEGDLLVGGLYGIALGSCFCAESMFHRTTNASKVALWAMVEKCRSLGFTIFDAQIMNPHLASLGAFPIPHDQYMEKLHTALSESTTWSVGGHPAQP